MPVTIPEIQAMKTRGEPIAMLTAYDATTARLLDEVGIPILLVGDSLGMVVLGYADTTAVTMEDMLHHTKAVVRGRRRALVVADMPFLSSTVSAERALENAGRFIQEAGAHAVKVEGGETIAPTIRRLLAAGVPVMGHVGLTPQHVLVQGGYRVQGRSAPAAEQVLRDALAVEAAGAFSVVLECIPTELAALITEALEIPTIGIGAGPHCDGQVQVIHDLVGAIPDFTPRHAKRYVELAAMVRAAVDRYAEEVRTRLFPEPAHGTSMDEAIVQTLRERLGSLRAG
ncbi:MAG: 3-methyl-2-oxobutanoate hydroxymethyltransferase [Candidatus Rokubacteria bacterium 13_1_40CM_69_27]|nr:MAG: 3-methyl-2-oxobutanoate hydroxymethyltransferase [Candidatus Rokubacteria bacterium 13_1_40CM_69_27]